MALKMNDKAGLLSGPGIMILSAVIFGFFGFSLSTTAPDAQFVLFMALLAWTLRISAILFVVSAAVTLIQPIVGNLLYFLVGGIGAGLFVVVVVLDMTNDKYSTVHPVILLLFAAWNGFGSWSSLRAVLAMRSVKGQAEGDAGA